MRKRVFGKQLSRNRGSRVALRRSLIKELVEHGGITTTKAKAKAIEAQVDKLMTLVGKGSLSARRQALSYLGNDKATVGSLFNHYVQLTQKRNSGFTRTTALPPRRGDMAEVVRIEWVEQPVAKEPEVKKKSKKAEKKS